MGTSGKKDSQLVSRRALSDFTDDALTISAVILFQKGTARLLKAYWRRKSRSVFIPQIEWLSENFHISILQFESATYAFMFSVHL